MARELVYLAVNQYSGDSKWVTMEQFNELSNQDKYWELDPTQKPFYNEPIVSLEIDK